MTLPISVSVTAVTPPARPPLWMVKEDRELFGSIRSCAPCPAVVILKDDPHATIDEQHQYYLRAANYAMDLEDVYLLLDKALAFANGTGFRKDGSPKADYFHNKDLTYKPPNLDKVRSCVRNVLTGTEQYSLIQTVKEVVALLGDIGKRTVGFRTARSRFAALLTTSANVLNVWTFDSRQPPRSSLAALIRVISPMWPRMITSTCRSGIGKSSS